VAAAAVMSGDLIEVEASHINIRSMEGGETFAVFS